MGWGILTKKFARTIPSPLRERVRVRGSMRLRRGLRSPHVPCFSDTPEPVNVPGGLAASPLATPLPARKSPLRGDPQLIPSGFRVGHQPASLQAMPSRRVHAPRPGLPETLRRFSAGPESRCKPLILMWLFYCFKGDKITWILQPVGESTILHLTQPTKAKITEQKRKYLYHPRNNNPKLIAINSVISPSLYFFYQISLLP